MTQTSSSVDDGAYPRTDVPAIMRVLEPLIVAHADDLENGEIADELVDALWDTGVFRAMLPARHGGLEIHPVDWLDLTYEISRLNGSVGWLAAVVSGGFDLRPSAVMDELLGDGTRWLTAGSLGRVGTAVQVDGGYRVSGTWLFATGIPFANFVTAPCAVVDGDGNPVIDPATGEQRQLNALLRGDEVRKQLTFDALGLRGTGSGGFSAEDVFMPERIARDIGDMPPEFASLPLFKYAFWNISHASHALGLAQGAIDAFIALAHRKAAKGSSRQARFAQDQIDQIAVGRADAIVQSAKHYAWHVTGQAFDEVLVQDEVSYELRVRLAQANTFASREAKVAMELVFEAAGTDAVIAGTKLERDARDLITITQHTVVQERTYDTIGQYLLTRDLPGGSVIDVERTMIDGPHPGGGTGGH
jgi:alkylation response protein AidB-like acyl-CoA dehydrogenase